MAAAFPCARLAPLGGARAHPFIPRTRGSLKVLASRSPPAGDGGRGEEPRISWIISSEFQSPPHPDPELGAGWAV